MTFVGDLIRARRHEKGISQSALGLQVGADRSYIAQIESGRTKWPESLIEGLRTALDIDQTELNDARLKDLSPAPEIRRFKDEEGEPGVLSISFPIDFTNREDFLSKSGALRAKGVEDDVRIGYALSLSEVVRQLLEGIGPENLKPELKEKWSELEVLLHLVEEKLGLHVEQQPGVDEEGRAVFVFHKKKPE